jgi:hypothetical protein
MRNQKAIVTLAIGEKYYTSWKTFCEPNWKPYAERYGFDLVCLESPLDTSERARSRSGKFCPEIEPRFSALCCANLYDKDKPKIEILPVDVSDATLFIRRGGSTADGRLPRCHK